MLPEHIRMMHRLPFYWVLYAPEKQQSIIVMQYLSTVETIILTVTPLYVKTEHLFNNVREAIYKFYYHKFSYQR